jgi:hypothetical protein
MRERGAKSVLGLLVLLILIMVMLLLLLRLQRQLVSLLRGLLLHDSRMTRGPDRSMRHTGEQKMRAARKV